MRDRKGGKIREKCITKRLGRENWEWPSSEIRAGKGEE